MRSTRNSTAESPAVCHCHTRLLPRFHGRRGGEDSTHTRVTLGQAIHIYQDSLIHRPRTDPQLMYASPKPREGEGGREANSRGLIRGTALDIDMHGCSRSRAALRIKRPPFHFSCAPTVHPAVHSLSGGGHSAARSTGAAAFSVRSSPLGAMVSTL